MKDEACNDYHAAFSRAIDQCTTGFMKASKSLLGDPKTFLDDHSCSSVGSVVVFLRCIMGVLHWCHQKL